MLKHATRQAISGTRTYASQASSVSKAQSSLASVFQAGSAAAKAGLYYTKVAGELAKYVWLKEGLAPPSTAEVQKVFTSDLKALYAQALESSKNPNKVATYFKSFKSDDYIRSGAIVVQLLGLFALGEIIGRRHIYGYKKHH